jgi:hypothetical protein
LTSFQTKLKQLDKDMARFILTCVALVQGSDSDQLRSTAWSTTATLLQSYGWEWLLVGAVTTTSSGQDAKKADFGKASSLCTLVRLAVGEWKIQLSLLVDESCTLSEERLLLVEACAQVLVEDVNFVVQRANRMDEADGDDDNSDKASLPLSADALIYLRQSLDEALNLAVQYLGLAEKRVCRWMVP